MCGIFGVITPQKGVLRGEKRMLALLNEDRGTDSVGFYADGVRMRVPERVGLALRHRRIPNDLWNAATLLGHTRAKSPASGAANKSNAHPFRIGNIVGAHNGFIANWKDLIADEKLPGGNNFNVDSQVIFSLLDVQDDLSVLEKLRGHGAAWWVDKRRPGEVFLWCSKQVLHMAPIKAGDEIGLAFSSEGEHMSMSGICSKPIKLKPNGQVIRVFNDDGKIVAKCIGTHPAKDRIETSTQSDYGFYGDARGAVLDIRTRRSTGYTGKSTTLDAWNRSFQSTNYYRGKVPDNPLEAARAIRSLHRFSSPNDIEKVAMRFGWGRGDFYYCFACKKVSPISEYENQRNHVQNVTQVKCVKCDKGMMRLDFPSISIKLLKSTGISLHDLRVLCALRKQVLVQRSQIDMTFEKVEDAA